MVATIINGDPIWFACVFSVILALGLREFFTLSSMIEGVEPQGKIAILGGLSALVCSSIGHAMLGAILFLALWVILLVTELFRKQKQPMHNVAFSFGGLMYVAFPLCCMSQIFTFGKYYLLAFFIFIWVGDTGAYCAGKLFGKHKMWERISPKKTWEGIAGGFVFALLSGALSAQFITGNNNPLALGIGSWMSFAVLTFAAGMLGDLVESLFKRYLNIKDSGAFLPGHGGVLDRFDSALLAAPAALALLMSINELAIQ